MRLDEAEQAAWHEALGGWSPLQTSVSLAAAGHSAPEAPYDKPLLIPRSSTSSIASPSVADDETERTSEACN